MYTYVSKVIVSFRPTVILFRIGFIFRVKFEDVIVCGAKFEYLVHMWV